MTTRTLLPRQVCGECGIVARCPAMILQKPVCEVCRLRLRRHLIADCPACNEPRVLAYYNADQQPSCARCVGLAPEYACRRCGREDHPFGRYCGRCTLHDRATELLTDENGDIHPQLQPVFDALMATPRPQTTLYWFKRSNGPDLLRRMARGELPISHAAFDELPSDRMTNYLRDLLAATGVLPAYQPTAERIGPWLKGILADQPARTTEIVERFARWHVLRKLRSSTGGQPSQKAAERARRTLRCSLSLLTWLTNRGTTLTDLTQADLEDYLLAHPDRADVTKPFIDWAIRSGLTDASLAVPVKTVWSPKVTLSDEQRWQHVETLLHDDTIRTYTRVAGLFMLLFAQPLSRVLRMHAEQISIAEDGTVLVTFDTVPIELPAPLDQLVLDQLGGRGLSSYISSTDRWLFPGGIPGRHLHGENVRSQLVARGINPQHGRKAAMFQLAADMPNPVLADILGLSKNTAARWGKLAARDWSQYTAQRAEYAPMQ